MKKLSLLSIATAVVVCSAAISQAATVTIEALDVRGTGIFGHDPNISGATINGGAFSGARTTSDPLEVMLTYNNLDLDGDSTANDSVTFTLSYTGTLNDPSAFNQGVDTGFNNLDGLLVGVTGVSGTTTDSGNEIVFDGFTGAAAAAGFNGDINKTVDINGTTVSLMSGSTGSFQFIQAPLDFGTPVATVAFDNGEANGGGGTLLARHFDLQFSTVPEPASFALFGLGVLGIVASRRRN